MENKKADLSSYTLIHIDNINVSGFYFFYFFLFTVLFILSLMFLSENECLCVYTHSGIATSSKVPSRYRLYIHRTYSMSEFSVSVFVDCMLAVVGRRWLCVFPDETPHDL